MNGEERDAATRVRVELLLNKIGWAIVSVIDYAGSERQVDDARTVVAAFESVGTSICDLAEATR